MQIHNSLSRPALYSSKEEIYASKSINVGVNAV